MSYDNSGALFRNEHKESDTHADSTGSATIDGVEYWVNAWRKTSKGGKKYLSLSFRRKNATRTGSVSDYHDKPDYVDDDLPF